jgi:hypothetical protein
METPTRRRRRRRSMSLFFIEEILAEDGRSNRAFCPVLDSSNNSMRQFRPPGRVVIVLYHKPNSEFHFIL